MDIPPNNELDISAKKNRFVYSEKLPSLQEMASCQVALAIWNGYISRCSVDKRKNNPYPYPLLTRYLDLYSTYADDTDKLMESLKTPRKIETILKISLKKIRNETEQYILRFVKDILLYLYPDVRQISTFKSNWCVWLPNGKIDYLKTAEIMVSPENNELNLITKFAIMCEFYMEEKLKTFALDSLPAHFIEKLLQLQVLYSTRSWLSYLTGDRCEEIDTYNMVKHSILLDGIAGIRINHFWHRLSDDNQVNAIFYMLMKRPLNSREKWEAIEPLIGSMSWHQQSTLLSMRHAGSIIIILSCLYSHSSECAVWAWKHCKDLMTNGEFRGIIRSIFSSSSKIAKNVFPTVVELWETTNNYQRKILAFEFETIVKYLLFLDNCFTNGVHYSSAAYILINKCLALMSMVGRKHLIMKSAVKLATGTPDPRYIQEILNLNLPNLEDQVEFKKIIMDSAEMEWRCVKLWLNGNFDIISVNLEYYYDGDVNSIREYSRKLLSKIISSSWASFADKSVFTNVNKWRECCQLIDKIFPDDATEASIAKQQLVSHFIRCGNCVDLFCNHLSLPVKMIESVFLNRAELNRVKIEFIKCHPTLYGEFWVAEDSCENVYVHSSIEWCCDHNEEAVVKLKNKIPSHDSIFDIVFYQLNKVYLMEGPRLKISFLTRLDKYLSWYLVRSDQIKAYKMHRLEESDKLAIFTTIFSRRDEQSLNMLVEWFFDGDEAKIRDFRSKKTKFW